MKIKHKRTSYGRADGPAAKLTTFLLGFLFRDILHSIFLSSKLL